jgi:hypothetical protein
MKQVFAALVPNVNAELASHVALRLAVRRQHRKGVPDLHTRGIDVFKLNALLISGGEAIVDIEEVSGHSAVSSSNKLGRVSLR